MADSPKQDRGNGSIKKRMVKMAALALVGQRYHCRRGDHLPVLPLLPQADENRTVNEKTAPWAVFFMPGSLSGTF